VALALVAVRIGGEKVAVVAGRGAVRRERDLGHRADALDRARHAVVAETIRRCNLSGPSAPVPRTRPAHSRGPPSSTERCCTPCPRTRRPPRCCACSRVRGRRVRARSRRGPGWHHPPGSARGQRRRRPRGGVCLGIWTCLALLRRCEHVLTGGWSREQFPPKSKDQRSSVQTRKVSFAQVGGGACDCGDRVRCLRVSCVKLQDLNSYQSSLVIRWQADARFRYLASRAAAPARAL
jgi:hypothetical protein